MVHSLIEKTKFPGVYVSQVVQKH